MNFHQYDTCDAAVLFYSDVQASIINDNKSTV